MLGLNPVIIVRDAIRYLLKAPITSLVGTLAVANFLVISSLFWFVLNNTDSVLQNIGRELAVTVYVDDALAKEDIEALLTRIADNELVEEVTYRTAEQEKERIVALLSADLLDGVDDEAIPSNQAIEVKFEPGDLTESRFEDMSAFVAGLGKTDGVEEVGFEAEHVGIIFAIGDIVVVTGWALTFISLLVAIFFIATLIRVSLLDRREELSVLHSLGATKRYLDAPFVLSGVLVGAAGAAIAIAVVIVIDGRLSALHKTAPNFEINLDLMGGALMAYCVVGGVVIGIAGTVFSIFRSGR